jgi:predicted dehydrogenase
MHPLDRREVLAATAAGLGFWVSGTPAEEKAKSPLDKIRWACIGVQGKGSSDTAAAAKSGDLVAICDVDETRLGLSALLYPKAAKFADFRVLLDKLGKSIDAVTVSTPDHTHAAVAAAAMRMGKHCFCQKPLTRTIYEARRLGEIARDKKVKTQMGNQHTASDGLRKAAALVKAGTLGPVKEVHVWTNRPVWKQGGERAKAAPVPKTLAWDLWLGPRPERPYAPGYHPFSWRGFADFGSGALGDMACHTFNLPFMALDLRDPISASPESSYGGGLGGDGSPPDMFPKWSIITFQFPACGKRAAVKVVWYDGGKLPPAGLFGKGVKPAKSGSLLVGAKGSLYAPGDNGTSYQLLGDIEEPKGLEFTKSPGHFAELVEAIYGDVDPVSNFTEYGGPLTETILLGNLAVLSQQKIEWDARKMKAKGASRAVEELIRPTYRKGWTL